MFSFKAIYFIIFILNLYKSNARISDKRLCIDLECSEPISHATALLKYSSPDERILSFNANSKVVIYSKEAGSDTSLWGAVIDGKRGYIPKNHVRENKILKKPSLLVDTEIVDATKPQVPVISNVNPHKVQEPYEVVDGTTIYASPQESTTESVLPPTSTEPTVPLETPKEEKGVVGNIMESVSSFFNEAASESEQLEEDDDDEEEDEDESEEDEEDDEKLENESNPVDPVPVPFSQNIEAIPVGEQQQQSGEENSKGASEDAIKMTQAINDIVVEKSPDVAPASFVPIAEEPKVSVEPSTPLPTVEMNLPTVSPVSSSTDEKGAADISAQANPPDISSSKDEKLSEPEIKEKAAVTEEKVPKDAAINSLDNSKDTVNPPNSVEQLSINSEDKLLNIAKENILEIKTDTVPSANSIEEQVPKEKVIETKEASNPSTGSVGEPAGALPSNLGQVLNLNVAKQNPIPATIDPPIVSNENKVDALLNSTDQIVNTIKKIEEKVDSIKESIPASTESIANPSNTEQNLTIAETEDVKNQNEELLVPKEVEKPLAAPLEISASAEQNLTTVEDAKIAIEAPLIPEVVDEPLVVTTEVPMENIAEEIPPILNNTIEETDKSFEPAQNQAVEENSFNTSVSDSVPDPSNTNSAESGPTPLPHLFGNTFNYANTVNENAEVAPEENNNSEENYTEEAEVDHGNYSFYEDVPSHEASQNIEQIEVEQTEESDAETEGFFSKIMSFFSSDLIVEGQTEAPRSDEETNIVGEDIGKSVVQDSFLNEMEPPVTYESCPKADKSLDFEFTFNSDIFLYLVTTAISVILFLFGYMALDKSKREGPLIARIYKLEKELLVKLKENEILQEKAVVVPAAAEPVFDEELNQRLAELQMAKSALEDQVQVLEKELDTSTEVGIELNRILTEMLNSNNGEDTIKANVEQLQRQLLEQQDTINTFSENLSLKETENHELLLEMEIYNKKVTDLQNQLDEMVDKVLKIEDERDQQQSNLESELTAYQQRLKDSIGRETKLGSELKAIAKKLDEAERTAQLKTKEFNVLKDSLKDVKSIKNNGDAMKGLLDVSSIKAELQQLKMENAAFVGKLQNETETKELYEKKVESTLQEIDVLKEKYEFADKEKEEIKIKLNVLNNYFKDKEAQMQKEISKYESMWAARKGEATSTTERFKHMQEELQNFKTQNETLKQEIISQEVQLKSQISMLEKKVHENWVTARQSDRKLQDAQQEAAQLRNRLTLRERAYNEDKAQNRITSPIEQNGNLPLSPQPIDSMSPNNMFRDHITKSPPPLTSMPPFLPPPPGAPFMPPHLPGMPPFMPPPPSMFPGDHRPPPLGRMSSPPLNSRYSPDSNYSPYGRNTPSPPYDSEYGTSPPMRAYSPYRDSRRDHRRPNLRNGKNQGLSSGSDHSNESMGNRKHSNV